MFISETDNSARSRAGSNCAGNQQNIFRFADRRINRALRAQKGLNRYARSAHTQVEPKPKAFKFPTKRFY